MADRTAPPTARAEEDRAGEDRAGEDRAEENRAGRRSQVRRALSPRNRSLRARSSALAALVVACTLALGAVLVLAAYRNRLLSGLDATLEQQAADRAELLEDGADPSALVTVSQEEAMVWIGTVDGSPVAVGGTLIPVDSPVPPEPGRTVTLELLVDENKPTEATSERELTSVRVASATTSDRSLLVLAGAEPESVDEAVTDLGRLFLIALPPLVALVAGLTWFTTGRALRPVERIRARADEISGTNLGGRVPVPAGDDEIVELASTMNRMLDRIESHEYSLRRFTADASHELKSPVANLRALVDTTELDDARWPAIRRQLSGESDRLRDLVDNLLFLAAGQAGSPTSAPGPVALDELLFVEAELLAATGAVIADLSGVQPARVMGSAPELGRLVRNLVDNAARHAESRVSLAIETDGARGPVTVVIGDDGPGVAAEDRERVFDRFTRLDQARARDGGGSGLGLAIVKQIADGHHATVTITTSPLGGAEFRVRFPAVAVPSLGPVQ